MATNIYIVDINDKPLMPTKNAAKIRKLLKANKAKVIRRTPFTVKLLYHTGDNVQPITLGIKISSKNPSFSATTEKEEVFAGSLTLRDGIKNNLARRKSNRKARRLRCRYRRRKTVNRKGIQMHYIGKGSHRKKIYDYSNNDYLPPSMQSKYDCYIDMVDRFYKLLPIDKIILELASCATRY